jgi:hypothetical protein
VSGLTIQHPYRSFSIFSVAVCINARRDPYVFYCLYQCKTRPLCVLTLTTSNPLILKWLRVQGISYRVQTKLSIVSTESLFTLCSIARRDPIVCVLVKMNYHFVAIYFLCTQRWDLLFPFHRPRNDDRCF